VLKYAMDTATKGLKIAPKMTGKLEWKLLVYSDSDWAASKDGRKSVGGYMIFLNDVLISWRSKMQRVVSLSSAEAEFYACAEATKEVPFLKQLLEFLGIKVELPIEIRIDNVGAIYMSQGEASTTRTRHMDVRWFYVNDLQDQGIIVIKFVKSEENVSDVATKNVSAGTMRSHVDKLIAEKDYWNKTLR
jgi:hypothetical protein